MAEEDKNRLQETCRLAFLAQGLVNKLDICISNLRNGYTNERDFIANKKTLERLSSEVGQLYLDTNNKLNQKES